MACSKHANYTNLDKFLEDIVAKRLNFSQSDLEVQVVCKLVHEMVNNIVKEASSTDSDFTVREIILVGSMAEGTRNIQPDEFDFMLVVDKFDADDIAETTSDCDGTFLSLKTKCGREDCACVLKEPGPTFGDFTTAQSSDCDCKFAIPPKRINRVRILLEAIYKMAKEGRSGSVESFPGKLRLTEQSICDVNGPAMTFTLLWEKYDVEEELKTMKISIDLVLMIELEINEFLLDRFDVFHQHYYNKLKAIKKVHFKSGLLFRSCEPRVSFALAEVQLMRDESETHEKCYKLLKYIYRTDGSSYFTRFSSFILKNLVLQHSVCCEGGGLGWCLLKILGDLRDKCGDERMKIPFIPHIYSTKKNLIRSASSFGNEEPYQESWVYHRKELSEFIENLEKYRDRSQLPTSFEFRIFNDIRAF